MTESIKKIVILTGAGISAESGIKTFRDQDGLWEGHDINQVATPQGFQKDPSLVYQFYNERRKQLLSDEVSPNAAHRALSKLESEFQGEVLIITQNVDDLHERAGNKNVLHMHGELLKMRCQKSLQVFQAPISFDQSTACECCQRAALLRPHIVWFGEVPFAMEQIQKELLSCQLFISIGTSGQVYPAATFYQWAAQGGAKTVELNLESTPSSSRFSESYQGKASELVPSFVEKILSH